MQMPSAQWAAYYGEPFVPPPVDRSHMGVWPRLDHVHHLMQRANMNVESVRAMHTVLNACGYCTGAHPAALLSQRRRRRVPTAQPARGEQCVDHRATRRQSTAANRSAPTERGERRRGGRRGGAGRNREVYENDEEMRAALGVETVEQLDDGWTTVGRETRMQLLSAIAVGVGQVRAL